MIRARRRGLTLVETMVSLGILLVMSLVIFSSLQSSIEFQQLLSSRDETLRTARAALSKLAHDLQLAYLTPNRTAVNTYQTVFVGLDDQPAQLFFTSLAHQRLYLDSRECDQTEITVWAETAPEGRGEGFVLYHREASRIDQYPDEGGRIWPLAYNVRSFTARYLNQATNEWQEEWDTRSGDTPYRLPRAVEIGLVLIAPDLEDPTGKDTVDVPFLTTVVLEYAERLPSLDPTAALVAAQTGQAPQTPQVGGGQGGYGGGGFTGLSGGQLGGALGAMGGGGSSGNARRPTGGRAPAGPAGAAGGGLGGGGLGGLGVPR